MRHEKLQKDAIESVSGKLAAGQDPLPLVVELHPTDRCNHRCSFCFHSGVEPDASAALPLARWLQLLDELSSLGVPILSISGGGEPFVCRDTAEIISAAAGRGMSVRVVTNGSLLGRREIAALLEAEEVRVSVDAIREETYAALRGVDGAMLRRVMDNLRELAAARAQSGARLSLGATLLLNELNCAEVNEFCREVLSAGADVAVIKHDVYGRWAGSRAGLRRELEALYAERVEFREELEMQLPGPCFVPYFKIAVSPAGIVHSCCLASQPGERSGFRLGDLKRQDFASVWNESRSLRLRMRDAGVSCSHCNHTDYIINRSMAQVCGRAC